MIYLDFTKGGSGRHQSGLMRVSRRLREELGAAATAVRWSEGGWIDGGGRQPSFTTRDWLLTPELFSEQERPGFRRFLEERPVRCAALFHDAIPLKLPHVTWPQSVARHPEYMKHLAAFDRVFAVSTASAEELEGFWRWQGVGSRCSVVPLRLGADGDGGARVVTPPERGKSPAVHLLCVGIIEPRKNQALLVSVAERLREAGCAFRLDVVGRTNPHFGKPIAAALRSLERRVAGVRFHEAVSDRVLQGLWEKADVSVFPTRAEGCGLPLLESLWKGVPCVCSDLPVLRENADGGGCIPVAVDDQAAWARTLHDVITDGALRSRLAREATMRALPAWKDTAREITLALGR